MSAVFPYDNVVAGVLVLIVGFGFHWIGQLVSVLNWGLATRLGLQDEAAPSDYKVYEHGIAMADVAIGWIYGIAGVGAHSWLIHGHSSWLGFQGWFFCITASVSGSGPGTRLEQGIILCPYL